MAIPSRFSFSIPDVSTHRWILSSCDGKLMDNKAWIDADRPETHFLTYAGARLLAKRIAVGLLEQGLRPADRVMLFTANSIFFPSIVMGIWMAGGIFTGANPAFTGRELAFQLKDSAASIIIAAEDNYHVAVQAARGSGMTADRVFVSDTDMPDSTRAKRQFSGGARHWTDLIASRDKGDHFIWCEPENPRNAVCTINYSSGTTGLPKGAEITHYNQVANGVGIVSLNRLHPEYEVRRSRSVALCFLPMHHAFSQGYFIASLPHQRVPIYVMPKFDLVKMLSHIQTYRITRLMAVPPVLMLMSRHPLARQADLSSLEVIGSGAAPLPSDTQTELNDLVARHATKLRQGWGMTEVTCTAIAWDPSRPFCRGVGELMPNSRARLVHTETGVDITQAMVPGELWIAGPSIMRGYWRNPPATRQAFAVDGDGTKWLRTGDIAYVEEYKPGTLFHIVDRCKELIKVHGYQVAPAELEALLVQRADVVDAAVVGVVLGREEVPRAYVVRTPGATASGGEIAAWLAGRVAQHKQLRGGIVFVKGIPKSPSGKILRRVLRQQAKQEVEFSARL
ncbi:hypothetical protein S40285_06257 [Stachybotrys chlorohalonatus IBT 40285]|uniref:AMP-dependent synthetase/ligase domain-containing protein n=1 Tax=Stachybotrys chlorohalonatus (strain IBT 40285) TaxID=1283841 RepID=A0A084QSR7_STAC4|nr:hypothetical protein S40285_06257 [Stachybotrys chlorohalonata IBT 40285]